MYAQDFVKQLLDVCLWEATDGGYLIIENRICGIQADADVQELRKTRQYQQWRKGVLERDNYTCVACRSDKTLHVHHVLPWAFYAAERLKATNGITLCRACHYTTHHGSEG